MESKHCEWCDSPNMLARADARFCSTRCRVYWNRFWNRLPIELTSRPRWIRYSPSKVPLTVDGRAASSTDPSTWATYAEAKASRVGAGLGFVLNGDGIAGYDLDHCVVDGVASDEARAFLAEHPGFYVETSPSGAGLHIWTHAERQKGYRRKLGGLNVEFYTTGRYLTVTGVRF